MCNTTHGSVMATLITMLAAFCPAYALTDAQLIALRDGYETMRQAQFLELAGQPLVIAEQQPPLGPGRALYTRHYSYSIYGFAIKVFWLDEEQYFADANAALIDNCRYYLDHPQARTDRDSFYWGTDVLCRIVEYFGSKGSRSPGRLSSEAEDIIYEMMWTYCNQMSRLTGELSPEFEQSQTWYIHESENHHIQLFSTLWHFLKLLRDHPQYRDRQFDDDHALTEHHDAWTAYSREYLRQRAKNGLFVEIANRGYNMATLKGIYNIYDFSPDPILRQRAMYLLDLYWATWAQEQLDGVRGGAQTRVYQGRRSLFGAAEGLDGVARYYLGYETQHPLQYNEFTVITSEYRMPLVVMDIALDPQGRGVYEIRQRPLGLAQGSYYANPDYRLRTDFGGILRYSFCCPEFIMGTLMCSELTREKWTLISSQNRWQGVVFDGDPDARIFPQCQADDGKTTFHDQWSVQRQGTMITQKAADSRGAGAMRVWFAAAGLSEPVERDGMVFAQSSGAFAAVRVVEGGYQWDESPQNESGRWLRCEVDTSPVIIEAARQSDYSDFETFINAVTASPCRYSEQRHLTYRGLGGDEFTFFADYSQNPQINGSNIDYAPANVFDSPFVQSPWDSGIVRISKDNRSLMLDFNSEQVLDLLR
ncbi:MAG: hypothetical protein IT445_11360 [Phycisphaeraceae bacterium]|nr:hypothetical protein [Phycisphaeraceae bacterium]